MGKYFKKRDIIRDTAIVTGAGMASTFAMGVPVQQIVGTELAPKRKDSAVARNITMASIPASTIPFIPASRKVYKEHGKMKGIKWKLKAFHKRIDATPWQKLKATKRYIGKIKKPFVAATVVSTVGAGLASGGAYYRTMKKKASLLSHFAAGVDVIRHKAGVYRTGRLLGAPRLQLLTHDMSKFRPSEFPVFANTFYNADGTRRVTPDTGTPAFRQVSALHKLRNIHHTKDHKDMKLWGEILADWYNADKRGKGYPSNFPPFEKWWKKFKKHDVPVEVVHHVNRMLFV